MEQSKFNTRKEVILYLTLIISSILISYMFNGNRLFSSPEYFFKNISFGILLGFSCWKGNVIIGKIISKMREWKKNALKANSISQFMIISYGIAISFIIPFFYYKYVFKVQHNLMAHILGTAFLTLALDFALSFAAYTSVLTKLWKTSIENEEKLKKENLIANYEALKNQVNPHFLFNTLNTLSGIIEKDSKLATGYVKKLSDTFRYVLDQKDKETVKISEELAFIEDFFFLQKMRYGNGLSITISIAQKDGYIVPMALQIPIENAIKHNIIEDDQPLNIMLNEEEDFYIIINNLQKKKTIQKNSKIGLDNLCKRYELLSEKKVEINENQDSFEVKIPKLKLIAS